MTLETESELIGTYEKIARLTRLIEKMQREPRENEELRDAEIDGLRAMVRKMERGIVAYYDAHPERLNLPQQAA